VGEELLRTVDESLLPRLQPGYQLASYYPLFEKIAQNEAVPQLRLIELLTKQMVSLAKKHDPDTELKSWSQGSKVVGICRIMLKHHHSSHIFLPLSHLLVCTIESFPDLEIRDHARYLYLFINHANRILTLLGLCYLFLHCLLTS
jgi:AP-5 complex subunit beta-1